MLSLALASHGQARARLDGQARSRVGGHNFLTDRIHNRNAMLVAATLHPGPRLSAGSKQPPPQPKQHQREPRTIQIVPWEHGRNTTVQLTVQNSSIPRNIVQTGKDPLSGVLAENQAAWKALDNVSYTYYDDDEAIGFLSASFGESHVTAFKTLRPGAFKADFFRYCKLYVDGGVYVDIDAAPLMQLDELLMPEAECVSVAEPEQGIYQALLACAPGSALMKAAVDLIVEHVEQRWYPPTPVRLSDGPPVEYDYHAILNITGPSLLGGVANLAMGRDFNARLEEGGHDLGTGMLWLHKLGDAPRGHHGIWNPSRDDSGGAVAIGSTAPDDHVGGSGDTYEAAVEQKTVYGENAQGAAPRVR